MSYEPWPSPDAPRGPLPRIDDLPLAEQGYDQEAVREAFDSFYRHAAQLDASLKALEAVDAFRQDAYELRNDLRSLRSLGIGGAPEPASWTTATYVQDGPRFEIPSALPRFLFEAALIVAVAVIAGVAHFQAWLIVALMVAAWALIGLIEWLAARARFAVPAPAFAPPLAEPEPEALTMIAPPEQQAEPEPPPEPEPEPEAEPEPEPAAEAESNGSEPSGHVRVLDGWEQGAPDDEPVEQPAGGFLRRRRR